MAEILIVIPEILRQKLGNEGAEELINLINRATKGSKENTIEVAAERFERRLAETKADLVKWMFVFWAGQVVVMVGLLSLFYNLLKN
ncbi:MAG: LA_3696 family protein [Desulfotomaculales bacterium]